MLALPTTNCQAATEIVQTSPQAKLEMFNYCLQAGWCRLAGSPSIEGPLDCSLLSLGSSGAHSVRTGSVRL